MGGPVPAPVGAGGSRPLRTMARIRAQSSHIGAVRLSRGVGPSLGRAGLCIRPFELRLRRAQRFRGVSCAVQGVHEPVDECTGHDHRLGCAYRGLSIAMVDYCPERHRPIGSLEGILGKSSHSQATSDTCVRITHNSLPWSIIARRYTYAATAIVALVLANSPMFALPHPLSAISTGSRLRPSGDR